MRYSLVVILVFAMLTGGRSTTADAQLADSYSLQTGTLNIILANPNGVVVASDSRRSSSRPLDCHGIQRTFCDDSQKVFRTGKASAVVIAGFANGGARGVTGTPLNVEMASLLRRMFGVGGRQDGRGDIQLVADDLLFKFRQILPGVAAVLGPSAPLDFYATIAGFHNRTPSITQLYFAPAPRQVGQGTTLVYFQVQSESVKAEHFTYRLVGCSDCKKTALEILNGESSSTEDAVVSYNASRATSTLDNLSTADMEALARAILRESYPHTNMIGGAPQVMTFPVAGTPHIAMPRLPTKETFVPSFYMRTACLYSRAVPGGQPLPGSEVSILFEAQNWGDAPMSQYFLASTFDGVSVVLDNNYFVDDTFRSVRFRYMGSKWRNRKFEQSPFVILRPRFDGGCTLELPEGVKLPRGSGLEECRRVPLSSSARREIEIGGSVEPKTTGRVTKGPDDTLVLRTDPRSGASAGISFLPVTPCQ